MTGRRAKLACSTPCWAQFRWFRDISFQKTPIPSFTAPVLNSVVARLLTYKEMWLIPGWLYMFTILITPIGVLTLSMPQWVIVFVFSHR